MSVELARTVYPLLVQIARELSEAMRERRSAQWVTYDEFCLRCRDLGVKETPRTVMAKLLKPIQAACIEHGHPDLSALVIQKPKARGDTGDLLRPSDAWWAAYVERQEATTGDIQFWFDRFKSARDFEAWPAEPFF
jgi:hypothetical protein